VRRGAVTSYYTLNYGRQSVRELQNGPGMAGHPGSRGDALSCGHTLTLREKKILVDYGPCGGKAVAWLRDFDWWPSVWGHSAPPHSRWRTALSVNDGPSAAKATLTPISGPPDAPTRAFLLSSFCVSGRLVEANQPRMTGFEVIFSRKTRSELRGGANAGPSSCEPPAGPYSRTQCRRRLRGGQSSPDQAAAEMKRNHWIAPRRSSPTRCCRWPRVPSNCATARCRRCKEPSEIHGFDLQTLALSPFEFADKDLDFENRHGFASRPCSPMS